MIKPVFCEVCHYPIMPNGCVHKILGFEDAEWEDMSLPGQYEAIKGIRLPRPYKDSLSSEIEIHLSLIDRIKVLLGSVIVVQVDTHVENIPWKFFSKSSIQLKEWFPRIFKKRGMDFGVAPAPMDTLK